MDGANGSSGVDVNPFSDPSVVRAARGNVQPAAESMDVNPFGDSQRPVSAARGAANPPPVLPTAFDNPTGAAAVGGPVLPGHADLLKRQEELERKAQELARKEEELRQQANRNARVPNWPPLPSWLPVQPCFFHDINLEIPQQYQRVVRMEFTLWMAYVLTLFANVIGSLVSFVTGGSAVQFGLSIVQVCLFTPCSFMLWYRPLYKAFKNDSSFNFMVYFFVMFLQLVFLAVQTLGLESFGTCGWINTLSHFGKNTGAAIVMLLVAASFTFCAVGLLLQMFRIHSIYRSSGASFQKAQQEFSQGIIANPHVQNAAVNVASSTVRGQFSSTVQSDRY